MFREFWLGLAVFVAVCVVARGARAAPPDPASAGEWLAYCSIQLPVGQSAEAKAAWRATLAPVLKDAARWVFAADSAAFTLIDAAVAEAVEGKAVALWLLPPSNGEPGPITVTTLDKVGSEPQDSLISPGAAEWPAHRAKVYAAHPDVAPAIEVAINLNIARRQFESAFDPSAGHDGRGARVLEALSLSNARVVGVHVRLLEPAKVKTRDPSLPRGAGSDAGYVGPMLAMVDATWSARSEAPGKVYSAPLTTSHWPQSQVGAPPKGAAAAAMRVTWRSQFETALRVYGGLLSATDDAKFERERGNWRETNKTAIDRLLSTIDPWIGLSLSVEAPGGVAVNARLRDDAAAAPTAGAFDGVTKELCASAGGAGSNGPWRWRGGPVAESSWWIRSVSWTLTSAKSPDKATIDAHVRVGDELLSK